ncbi:MAG: hypothetical protein A2219_00055 [Elusimicrobia bacterium RIFOXYA2_FULL_50_26]|nr:MAG: hypothetical protein A2219_00055 [Elusimicrobia bacterium RIFOXYA2_FULL_50_26]OGS22742.1 MAG: hypothetical protein A2314_00420 [Elusimicrobia bacterium RIFOXYB2_FULL_50_12]
MSKRGGTIILFSFVVVFGGYLFVTRAILWRNPAPLFNHDPARCTIRLVDATPRHIPPVLILNDFETQEDLNAWFVRGHETHRVAMELSARHVTHGRHCLKIEWRAQRWTELVSVHFPRRWQAYGRLCLDVYNPGPGALRMEFRIGDYFDTQNFHPVSSRFIATKTIGPGRFTVVFKSGELQNKIALESPKKIIHLRIIDPGRIAYVDALRLESPR